MLHTSSLRSLFITPGFLALSAFRLCRSVATWLELALIYWLLAMHFQASTATLTLAALLVSIPQLLLTPIAGAFCDHHSPVRVMQVSMLCRAGVALLMSIDSTLSLFMSLLFVRSLAMLGEAAEPVVNRRLLLRRQLLPAARMTAAIEQGARLFAPAIGIAATWLAPARNGFLVCACLCGLCAISSVYLGGARRCGWPKPSPAAVKTYRSGVLAGMTLTLMPRGALLRVCTIYTSLCFSLGSLNPLMLVLLRDNNLSPVTLGVLAVSMSAGALLGSLGFGKIFPPAASLSNVLVGAQLAVGCAVACMGLLSNFFYPYPVWLLMTLHGVIGFFFASATVSILVIIQDTTPVHSIGVVSGITKCLFFLFTMMAPTVSALVAQTIDAYAGLFIVGMICILIGAVASLRDPA